MSLRTELKFASLYVGGYPVRIEHIVLVDVTMLVRVVLKALKRALPAKMRSKFRLSSTANDELYEQHAGRDELPDYLGGGYMVETAEAAAVAAVATVVPCTSRRPSRTGASCTKHAVPGRPSWSRPMASASRSSTRAQSRFCLGCVGVAQVVSMCLPNCRRAGGVGRWWDADEISMAYIIIGVAEIWRCFPRPP